MNLYDPSVPIFSKMLRNLGAWIDLAANHARETKADPEALLQARLAPDMYPFVQQVQLACDEASAAAAGLAGREPPSRPHDEADLAAVRARIAGTVEYLESFSSEDFAGAEDRACTHFLFPGRTMRGADFFNHWWMPNFLFHLTLAYGILRNNGVPLGKREFIGQLPFAS
jgi:hypothetical protein